MPTVATPVITPAAGEYTSVYVEMSCATPLADIYYTLDGTDPDATKNLYTAGFQLSVTTEVKAIGILTGDTDSAIADSAFTIKCGTPVANPTGSSVIDPSNVALSTTTPGADIYYTTDGSVPTIASTLYVDPLTLPKSCTLKAIAIKTDTADSDVMTEAYTVTEPEPTISPAAGTFTSSVEVTLSGAAPGATIYYTDDGSTPDGSSTEYTVPVVVNVTTTLKAIALKVGCTDSDVQTQVYTIILSHPEFDPPADTYTAAQTVTMTQEAGAAIHYTINGTEPTIASPLYTVPISVSATETVKAIATKTGCTSSAVNTGSYIINSLIGISYEVQVASDAEFTSIIYDEHDIGDTTLELDNLEYSTEYFWRVRGTKNGVTGSWSEVFSFTTTNPGS